MTKYLDYDGVSKLWGKTKNHVAGQIKANVTDKKGVANGIASLDANGRVPIAQLGNLDTTLYEVVKELPASDIKSHIYLKKSLSTGDKNLYAEYIYVDNAWEKLGEFKADVDLSGYVEKETLKGTLLHYLSRDTGGDVDGDVNFGKSISVDGTISSTNGKIIIGNPKNPYIKIEKGGIKIGKYLIGEELAGGFITRDGQIGAYDLPKENAGTLLTDTSEVIYTYGQRIEALETKNTEQDTAIGDKADKTELNNYLRNDTDATLGTKTASANLNIWGDINFQADGGINLQDGGGITGGSKGKNEVFTADGGTKDLTEVLNKLAGIPADANHTTVDAALNNTSTNPVQNKAVYTALSGKVDNSTYNAKISALDNMDITLKNTIADKADKTLLNSYLPLSGGTLNGNLTVNKAAISVTDGSFIASVATTGITMKEIGSTAENKYTFPRKTGTLALQSDVDLKVNKADIVAITDAELEALLV